MRISGVWKLLFLINGNYHYSMIVWYLIPGNQNLPENTVIPTKNALIFDWIQQFFDLQKQNLSILISIKKNPTREKAHIWETKPMGIWLAIGSSGRQNCVFDWKKKSCKSFNCEKMMDRNNLMVFLPEKNNNNKIQKKKSNQNLNWMKIFLFFSFSFFLSLFPYLSIKNK